MALLSFMSSVSSAADQIKVLIIDGVNNHDWEMTTEATKATLEHTGRFKVDVSTSPPKRASKDVWETYHPTFSNYDVVIANFNNDCELYDENPAPEDRAHNSHLPRRLEDCSLLWSEKTRADLEGFVRTGGGLVVLHGADNSWASWPAYNDMIGLGGWGGRAAGKSGYLLRKINGQWRPTSPNEGLSGEHGREREFLVIHDEPSHPILRGLPGQWVHAQDELYSALRGPAKNIEVLAHAYSRVTKEDEPILFLIRYGKGRVFHIPMGHDRMEGDEGDEGDESWDEPWDEQGDPYGTALHCVGYQTVLARGTEYVATGRVTLGIPDFFPTQEEAVVMPPDKVNWPGRDGERARTSRARNRGGSETVRFAKKVSVFGLPIYATNTTGDDKLLHAANVLAEYIDNDEDGRPDNPKILAAVLARKGAIVMRKTDRERPTGPRPRGQGLWDEGTIPNGEAQGRFDASLEEILHMVTDYGWEGAYPEVFGRWPDTEIADAMDLARGGRFMDPPDTYPKDAWYTYDDETCDYNCQVAEYIYWTLTSILGAQAYPGRLEQIDNEWRLNTREKVKVGDPAVYAILTNPKYKLPCVLPDGKYKAKTFMIQVYP
jgi:hypothetical protein